MTPALRAFGLLLQDSHSCFIQLNSNQMSNYKKLPDFQQTVLHGRIAHMEVAEYQDRKFLAVSLVHTISETADLRIKFTNSNGLLTAYNNGTLVVGQELTISGTIRGIRAFYMKDDVLTPLKMPEVQFRCMSYAFGSKPQPKPEATPMATPTLEEIAF